MSNLTIYKELTYIETFDGNTIPLAEDYDNVVAELNSQTKFINLWSEMLAKSAVKRVFRKETNEVDNLILNIADKNLRARIKAVIDGRLAEWKKVNAEIFYNILERLKNE